VSISGGVRASIGGKISAERQKNTELNQQLHVLKQTLKG